MEVQHATSWNVFTGSFVSNLVVFVRPYFNRDIVDGVEHSTIARAVAHLIQRYLLNFQYRLSRLETRPIQLLEVRYQALVQHFTQGPDPI